jgi:hypothetical protein
VIVLRRTPRRAGFALRLGAVVHVARRPSSARAIFEEDRAMDTVTRFPERSVAAALPGQPVSVRDDGVRELKVRATYLLSEEGRKASLVVGGNGQAVQQVTIAVPTSRLHLVAVDRGGAARLKLRPRYELDDARRIVRLDSAPTFDAPPALDDLLRLAAKNYELEQGFYAERTVAKATRAETERQFRERIAQAFLGDKEQRALPHPTPSPKRCVLKTRERGRLTFDAEKDDGAAREVPAEAHRRFRGDLRRARERGLQSEAEAQALHREKKLFIAEWISEHGTPEQRTRLAGGVLPMAEAVEAIAERAFAALGDLSFYERDRAVQLQAYLRRMPEYRDVVIAREDVAVFGTIAVKMSADQWALVRRVQAALPDANVCLLEHRLRWTKHPNTPTLTLYRVLATLTVGPFTVRREYSAPHTHQP